MLGWQVEAATFESVKEWFFGNERGRRPSVGGRRPTSPTLGLSHPNA